MQALTAVTPPEAAAAHVAAGARHRLARAASLAFPLSLVLLAGGPARGHRLIVPRDGAA